MFTAHSFIVGLSMTRVFEYDGLICVTWRQTEQQNICRSCRSGRWSGRFSPLPLRGPPTHAPLYFSETRSPLRPSFGPLRSVFRSAHMLCSSVVAWYCHVPLCKVCHDVALCVVLEPKARSWHWLLAYEVMTSCVYSLVVWCFLCWSGTCC